MMSTEDPDAYADRKSESRTGLTLSDGVIVLRRRTLADVDAQIVGQDSVIVSSLDWDEPTRENVTAMIEASGLSWDAQDGRCDFGVYDVLTDDLVGNALANFADPVLQAGEVNVAYAVFAPWRGKGVATRIVAMITEWVAAHYPTFTPVLKIDADNSASISVAKRSGFHPDGSLARETGELIRWVRSPSP